MAVAVESMRQFQAVFGGYIGGGFLAYSVRAFFENGGRRARIVRVASDDPTLGAAAGVSEHSRGRRRRRLDDRRLEPRRVGQRLSVALVERTAGPGSRRPEPLAAELRRGRFDLRFRRELARAD